MTLTWTQPPEIASLAQLLMIYLYGPLKRNTEKRVRPSCKLSKGNDWMETQMKRIGDSHQDVWGHDHKIIRMEWKCSLVEDHTSFELRRMMIRTDQLLCIAEATVSKFDTRESGAGTCDPAKALVLSLKQFMPISTGFMTREPPGQRWSSKAYTLVIPSSIQMYWHVWALSHSAHGVLNLEGTLRQLLPTSERCTIV